MSDQQKDVIVGILSSDGWTCEYHEPDLKCKVCQRLHNNTADRILEALGITTEDNDGD